MINRVRSRRLILFIIFLGFIYFSWIIFRSGVITPEIILLQKEKHPLRAIGLFIIIYAVSVIAMLPSLPLNLAGGFFWGGMAGGVLSTIAVTFGSWGAFCVSRSLIGKIFTQKFDIKWVGFVQEEFEKNKWFFVALLRLNPTIPTGPLNYILGMTSISNKCFLFVTFFCLLIPATAVSYIGYSIKSFSIVDAVADRSFHGIIIISGSITALMTIKLIVMFFNKYQNMHDK